jgi:hypothetical protein
VLHAGIRCDIARWPHRTQCTDRLDRLRNCKFSGSFILLTTLSDSWRVDPADGEKVRNTISKSLLPKAELTFQEPCRSCIRQPLRADRLKSLSRMLYLSDRFYLSPIITTPMCVTIARVRGWHRQSKTGERDAIIQEGCCKLEWRETADHIHCRKNRERLTNNYNRAGGSKHGWS